MQFKQRVRLPKFLVQTIGSSCSGFPTTIFLGKVILGSLKKSHWNLSASRFSSNNTVCFMIKADEQKLRSLTCNQKNGKKKESTWTPEIQVNGKQEKKSNIQKKVTPMLRKFKLAAYVNYRRQLYHLSQVKPSSPAYNGLISTP